MKKITLFLFVLLCFTITNIEAQITSYPYTEDFESGDGGWVADNNSNGSWALGSPAGAIINSAASGSNAWVTNLTGNYNSNEDSSVTSPVFDLSSLSSPSIEMSIWYDIEFSWDGAVLQSSIDSGASWQNVGAAGDPNNWYTDNTINGNPGGQQEGWSGTGTAGTNAWVTARHALDGLAGEANVIFRIAFGSDGSVTDEGFGFDDVSIFEVSCPEPTALTVDNITQTTADVSWNSGGTETLWNLEWGVSGFTPGTGTLESGLTVTSFNLTGLVEGTVYDVYVVADCGGSLSSAVGPFTFNTPAPGGTCNVAIPMTVETDCSVATPTTFDFSISEDIDAAGENPSCDGFGNFGYWVSFTAPTVGSVVFNFGTGADNIGLEILDTCGGTSLGCFNNIFDDGDSSDIISGLTPGNTYVALLWRDTQAGSADICIQEGPTCTFPTNLGASNVTIDGADLSWTENGSATVWNVEVVPTGDTPTGTPTATGVSNPYTVTGLMSNTDYDFYVQADCSGSDTSNFSGPFTFTTACDVFTPDYIEQFDTIIPNCWDEADSGDSVSGPGDFGTGAWIADEFINIGTNDGAYKINLFTTGKSDWILSPIFDLTGGPFQVEFDFAITNWNSSTVAGTLGSDDIVQLLITQDGGASWTPLLTYDSTSVVPLPGITPVVTLEAYAGQTVQFGILGSEGTVDDPDDIDVFVDNFRVRGIPTCPEPTDLTATNLSLTSTEIGWTETGTSTVWNIEYGVAGFTPGTGTLVTGVTTNPLVLTGLTSDTQYEFYVQAECDFSNLSSFGGPGDFFTGYCESEPTSNDGEGVTNVTIGVTDFPSLGDVTYENQTSPVVNVFQGINTNVAITFATGFTYGTNIWIDFNDDLIFDSTTELVFSGESTNANPTTLDASFVMPITAPLGENRMRIGTADTGQATPNPCYNGSWGVTLDFTVNIQELACTLPAADFTVSTDCDNDQFFIDVDVTSLGDANSLAISNDFDATTVQATAAGIYQSGPFPFGNTVKVFVTNEQDNNCVISSPFFEVLACPPVNDECSGAITAVVNDNGSCDMLTSGTILAATTSNVPSGSCTGDTDDDVWFEFTALSEVQIISILNVTGGTFNIDHAVYEGTCGTLTELYCSNDDASVTPQLVVGNTYYLRVFSGGSQSETSSFDICIRNAPSNIICENAENFCSDGGALSTPNIIGIPDPNDLACLGTAPNPVWNIIQISEDGPIEIQINQQDDNGNGLDVDFVLWGPFTSVEQACMDIVFEDCPTCPNNTSNPNFYPFGNIVDCSYSAASVENLSIDNAIAGEIYMLLVTNFNGNPGTITIEQTNTNDTGSGEISAEIEAEIISNEVVFVDVDSDPSTPVEANVCGFDSVTIETNSPFADEFIWYEDGFVMPGETGPSITVTSSNSYQVQAFDTQCGVDTFSQIVVINLYEDPGALDSQSLTVCDGPEGDGTEVFDLDDLTRYLEFGSDFIVSYYTNTADANQAMNAVTSPYTSAGETLIIRVEDADAAANGFLGCRQLSEVVLTVDARPSINQPADFIVCDDLDGAVDGATDFDLSSIDPEVSTDPDITISYHTSQEDADNGTGALASPYTSSGETIYLRALDSNTGCYTTTSFNLVVNIVPLASFDPQIDYEVCPNATVPIIIGIIPNNFTESEVTVNWYLDGTLITGASGLTLDTVLVEGDYSAEITFSATGCVNTVSQFVMELESCVIPEGISPGVTPGFNDSFDLSSYDVTRLEIFNRNGTLVYSKDNYSNEWVGQTNSGEELPVGTYFYTMIYEGGAKKRSAWIYINR